MAANHIDGRHHTVVHIPNDNKKCKKCIFRVPNVLRRQNPQAYTPDVVSIGPFHHHKPGGDKSKEEGASEKDIDFQRIEGVKQNYLNEILTDDTNITSFTTLEELTAEVIKLSGSIDEVGFNQCAREFYEEQPLGNIPSKEFTKMMILDGCFLVQLFRKFNHQNLRAFDDLVFNMDCMFYFLCHDILLLENQLPWFVIHTFYNLTHKLYPNEAPLSSLILDAFSTLPSLKQSCSKYKNHIQHDKKHSDSGFLHILDLLRSSIVFPLRTIEGRDHSKPIGENVTRAIFDPDQHQIRTATSLSKADIKFQMVKRESIMDIRFEKGRYIQNGILMIPQLNIGMASETLFRNFIAIEQCYHGYLNEITSYAILMDNLISSEEDMELLCKNKVIGNWMSDEDGCKFFSNLYKNIPHNKFYYVDLCKEVNDCYKLKWYEWMVLLKSEKFSNPWRILAFGVAIILLILTAWSQTNNIRVNMHK